MMLLLFLLALAMIVTGVASAMFGAPIVQLERGHTMIIAGSVVASSGILLFGLTFVCYRLKKIQREVRRLGDRLIRHGDALRSPADGGTAPSASEPRLAGVERPIPMPIRPPETADAEILPPVDAPVPEPAAPPPEPPAPHVVGKYASGGNSYVMYSDGSIHADTPSGHHKFTSLEDLKAFVAAGGERG